MLRREIFFEEESEGGSRRFRQRINFTIADSTFKESFRLNRSQVEFLLTQIGVHLQHVTRRSNALSPKEQLLMCLHWLGNGCQYHGIAAMHEVAKSTVCRTVHGVVNAIVDILFQAVRWPKEIDSIPTDFFLKGGFPNVCGCVDGTLVRIDAPSVHEEMFVDRHGNHSLNVMLICGPNNVFYSANANWPGSVHDARVLRNSAICHRFEGGWRPFPQGALLGDSAYGLKSWLIPPLRQVPTDTVEHRFNCAHKKTRRIIENSIGILKERFPCLNHLRLEPEKAGKVVLACVTLHNIACTISREERENEEEEEEQIAVPENELCSNENIYNELDDIDERLQNQEIV